MAPTNTTPRSFQVYFGGSHFVYASPKYYRVFDRNLVVYRPSRSGRGITVARFQGDWAVIN